ncbi:MAG: hypothetical protein ACE5ID_06640 [Acidobacteriota bacterium]
MSSPIEPFPSFSNQVNRNALPKNTCYCICGCNCNCDCTGFWVNSWVVSWGVVGTGRSITGGQNNAPNSDLRNIESA